jgi:hypothetical protein
MSVHAALESSFISFVTAEACTGLHLHVKTSIWYFKELLEGCCQDL